MLCLAIFLIRFTSTTFSFSATGTRLGIGRVLYWANLASWISYKASCQDHLPASTAVSIDFRVLITRSIFSADQKSRNATVRPWSAIKREGTPRIDTKDLTDLMQLSESSLVVSNKWTNWKKRIYLNNYIFPLNCMERDVHLWSGMQFSLYLASRIHRYPTGNATVNELSGILWHFVKPIKLIHFCKGFFYNQTTKRALECTGRFISKADFRNNFIYVNIAFEEVEQRSRNYHQHR